ncbi:MAG: hypothetical protein JSS00_08470 [Proteobacteria bacterium]|nr:hypothetical protein [Pseudomonadota bacterium]
MRLPLAAVFLSLATSAAAQTLPPLTGPAPTTVVSPEIARASHALAAIWRPLAGPATEAGLTAACNGAVDDMRALDNAMPDQLNAAALAALHPAHGIVFVPAAEDPSDMFAFPSSDLTWFASGLGKLVAANEGTGEVSLRDAEGHAILITLGHVAGHAMLRLTVPGGDPITYVGCAATVN